MKEYWPIILQMAIPALLVGIIAAVKAINIKNKVLKAFVDALVNWAEVTYGSGTGTQKKEAVTQKVVELFPNVKPDKLTSLIEDSVKVIKESK